jgi:hypothetical protein
MDKPKKSSAAAEMGKRRMAKMTAKQREEFSRKAARKRWGKRRKK